MIATIRVNGQEETLTADTLAELVAARAASRWRSTAPSSPPRAGRRCGWPPATR